MSDTIKLSDRAQIQRAGDGHREIHTETPPYPRNMMIELTNACNHACIFCTSAHMTRKIGRIDGDLLKRLLVEGRELGVEEIGFYTTGDPFVDKRLEQHISDARSLGYTYLYISTNGAIASTEQMRAAIDAGLSSIKFSINAGTRETYKLIHGKDDWDKVMENLNFISEYRKTLGRPLSLFVSSVVTNKSQKEKLLLQSAVGDLVDEVVFYDLHNQNGPMAGALEILSLEGGSADASAMGKCMMPFNRFHVTCEGHLTLCCTDYQNYLTVADLKEVSLKDAWECDAFRNIRRRHLDDQLSGTLCGTCLHGGDELALPLQDDAATIIDFDKFQGDVSDRVFKRLALDRGED